ncbi:conserved hypothetical protein [Altererythrobacter sp. B11]|uniref:class I SAM-dependent methyltransferase n=1 Tax=Altererythrobacter sp. B11 TaxID=2060312 RepID=UPI000DC71B53|nr:class I SAM-dependent methyltransferase [Altererythrobacter sp. B11]BBC71167.1 conserved hypothetical protein [Altererythrobacter sp. B11]
MTSRNVTGLLALPDEDADERSDSTWSDRAYRIAFGAIGWPWLLYSLWGGTKASKRELLARVGLGEDALPHLGSWKADTGFLHRIVDAVEEIRPRNVVELGAGATTLVCARALQHNGGGRLFSYDQHRGFVAATAEWVEKEGGTAALRHAPLTAQVRGWPGRWYALRDLPDTIDLLIIDGPPWAIHPFVRGGAECLFDRLSPGGIVLLDDAARPGERIVARRWRKAWPEIRFERLAGSTKGTLIGRKLRSGQVIPMPHRARAERRPSHWRRAAAMAALLVSGWLAHDVVGDVAPPAHAASFFDEAAASYDASQARQRMVSQLESTSLDRAEIARATGLRLPDLPRDWELKDVQVFPSDLGISVALMIVTESGDEVSLFATRAETPAEKLPLLERRERRSMAYWEEGSMAYALTGELASERVLALASELAGQPARS